MTQLSADLNGLIAGCNARHRLNLTVEISRLENELKNLGKRIDDVENSVAVNYKSIGTITHDLTELVVRDKDNADHVREATKPITPVIIDANTITIISTIKLVLVSLERFCPSIISVIFN